MRWHRTSALYHFQTLQRKVNTGLQQMWQSLLCAKHLETLQPQCLSQRLPPASVENEPQKRGWDWKDLKSREFRHFHNLVPNEYWLIWKISLSAREACVPLFSFFLTHNPSSSRIRRKKPPKTKRKEWCCHFGYIPHAFSSNSLITCLFKHCNRRLFNHFHLYSIQNSSEMTNGKISIITQQIWLFESVISCFALTMGLIHFSPEANRKWFQHLSAQGSHIL